MAADVTIPRLGWSMEEGVFAGWIKKPGDTVKPGEPLFMLEGEKATQEIEAVDGGVLHLAPDAPSEGQTVLVGRTIGQLCAAGETPTWAENPPPAAPAATPQPAATDASGNGKIMPPPPIPTAASPRARRAARERGIDVRSVHGGGAGGRVRERDVLAAAVGPRTAVALPGGDLGADRADPPHDRSADGAE